MRIVTTLQCALVGSFSGCKANIFPLIACMCLVRLELTEHLCIITRCNVDHLKLFCELFINAAVLCQLYIYILHCYFVSRLINQSLDLFAPKSLTTMIQRRRVATIKWRRVEKDVLSVSPNVEVVMMLLWLQMANYSKQLERRCRQSELRLLFCYIGLVERFTTP